MKLIIDIPESIFNTIQADEMIHILNGTPLEDVKAEINSAKVPKNRMSFFRDGIDCALQILDNIGKAESED